MQPHLLQQRTFFVSRLFIFSSLMCFYSSTASAGDFSKPDTEKVLTHQHDHANHSEHKKALSSSGYSRTIRQYNIPSVNLVNMYNETVSLKRELYPNQPVLVNFIFTSCTTICPVMSATFAEMQRLLGSDANKVRLVSISIDPEHDTPERLRSYARKFSAGKSWHFLTGRLQDILDALKALDAYRGNKMNHQPIVLLRAAGTYDWIRIDGLTSARDLMKEYLHLPNKL